MKRARIVAEPPHLFLSEFPQASYRRDLARAKEVYLVGVSLRDTLKTDYERLKDRVRRGRSVKILLAKPYTVVVKPAALRSSRLVDVDPRVERSVRRKRTEIQKSLDHARSLRAAAATPNTVEIRTTEFPFGYGVHAMDPTKSDGVLYVKFYPYRTREAQKPKLVLRNRQDRAPFEQELFALWESGKAV